MSKWEKREKQLRSKTGRVGGPLDGKNLFRLARELKGSGVGLGGWWALGDLERACKRLGARFTDVGVMLAEAWKAVQTAPDTDAVALAVRCADSIAHRFRRPARSETYATIAAVCYTLSVLSAGEFFAVPSVRLAKAVGAHRVTVGSLLAQLERDGVIELRRDEHGKAVWSRHAGIAKEARYIGPVHTEEAHDGR